ncbi:glutathione transferase [Fragilaria crotonensis]|nr:glutathione transferase [Fragilaria crotonensis]
MSCHTDPSLVSPAAATAGLLQDRIKPTTLIKVGTGKKNNNNDNNDNNCENDNDIVPRFIVGYWSTRGLGAPLRMMLSAARVPHWVALYDVLEEDEVQQTSSVPGWNKKSWMKEKEWMMRACNPFMNLPYLIDVREQFVLTQANAILSYLGQELGMMGSTKLETAKCEELLGTIYDMRDVMVNFAYYGTPTAEQCWTTAQQHFQGFESHLRLQQQLRSRTTAASAADDGTLMFLIGPKTSAPDFHLYEMLDQYEILAKEHGFKSLVHEYPYLALYKKAMEELPEHENYLKSFLHQGLPLNNPMHSSHRRYLESPTNADRTLHGETRELLSWTFR